MATNAPLGGFRVYSTCPPSNFSEASTYRQSAEVVARWSEEAGCDGMLVYTDNGLVDPWLAAHVVIGATERLAPLVAVQPVYMHPYSVAKMVWTYAFLHGRRVALNMVAGGFKTDLLAIGDTTPHDRRYDRLVEYTQIITRLLQGGEPVTFEGEFYQVKNLKMPTPLDADLFPAITVSGSSDAGLNAARAIGAVAVQYPKPVAEYEQSPLATDLPLGIRVGVVARDDSDEAWAIARERFPEDRKGQITHKLAMKVSDSKWHEQLSELGEVREEDSPYWMIPFENYKTFCPYLVGSYRRVAAEIARYVRIGYETFILDVPISAEELGHIGEVFRRAREMANA